MTLEVTHEGEAPDWQDWSTVVSFTGLEVEMTVTPEGFPAIYKPAPGFNMDGPKRFGISVPQDLLPAGLVSRQLADRRSRATRHWNPTRLERPIRVSSTRRPEIGPYESWELLDLERRKARALNRSLDSVFIGRLVRLHIDGFRMHNPKGLHQDLLVPTLQRVELVFR